MALCGTPGVFVVAPEAGEVSRDCLLSVPAVDPGVVMGVELVTTFAEV